MLPVYQANRYVTPLREGGSLPAVLDTEGGGLLVVKFRGAGQGARALVAEILVGRLALALGLPVPEVVLVELDACFGRSERDPEIQDILKGSQGLNVGCRYLEGAFNFDPLADSLDPVLAADVVWLDALVSNVDRTAHNPNLMWWQDRVWLIDHGAALYFHHSWEGVDEARARDPFAAIEQHVLLTAAGDLRDSDGRLATVLTPTVLGEAVAAVPDALLMDAPPGVTPPFPTAAANRHAYLKYLSTRLTPPRPFVEEAVRAREQARQALPQPKGYRR